MSTAILEMKHISKRFDMTQALDDVSLDLYPGEIHALVGENGAGKSTLIKITTGVYRPDQGEILLDGKPVHINSSQEAQALGIAAIYQEPMIYPDLNVAENIFISHQDRGPIVRWGKMYKDAEAILAKLDVKLDVRMAARGLTLAAQQAVEIAKAISLNAQIVIMDEPSATLGGQDLERLFEVIIALKKQAVTVIYISHRLAEVFQVADRVTVFKDGKVVHTSPVPEIDRPTLVRMMIGRAFSETFPPRGGPPGEEVLSIQNLTSGSALQEITMNVRRGEIVSLAGLTGSGRTELARAIFGARRIDQGEIRISGKPVKMKSPRDALKNNIGFLTEDRNEEGLVLGLSVQHNAALPSLKQRQRWGILNLSAEEKVVKEKVDELSIRTPSLGQGVEFLSGGNRQKVVLAKWLITNPELLIFDEPTRGIDVGAKSEIWHLMRELSKQGKAILMISSELPEVIGMSDRIVVLHRGRIVGEMPGAQATEEKVLMLATYGE